MRELKQDMCIRSLESKDQMCKEMGRELEEAVGVIRPPSSSQREGRHLSGEVLALFNTIGGKLLRSL